MSNEELGELQRVVEDEGMPYVPAGVVDCSGVCSLLAAEFSLDEVLSAYFKLNDLGWKHSQHLMSCSRTGYHSKRRDIKGREFPSRLLTLLLMIEGTLTMAELRVGYGAAAWRLYRGNISRIARCMGVSRPTLYNRPEKYGLPSTLKPSEEE